MTAGNQQPSGDALFAAAWNREQAENSMQRWFEFREAENLGPVPADLVTLARLFGASWYFTRYVFFRGADAVRIIDDCTPGMLTADTISAAGTLRFSGDIEEDITALTISKNEWMMRILIAYLRDGLALRQVEYLLTILAESILKAFFDHYVQPVLPGDQGLAILAMGRMSGHEMTYGSDLDLIFLYRQSEGGDASALVRQIQKILRHLGGMTAAGLLYEVDMRLRPHGTAGSLITSLDSFLDYHAGQRDIWERQMMTRCRPIYDPDGLAEEVMGTVSACVYRQYTADHLCTEIAAMRSRVQRELGQVRGRHELKRGRGGLMDIDFICHYLQLLHGRDDAELRTCSTRAALEYCSTRGIVEAADCSTLLQAYDLFKRIEMTLRLWDLKSVDQFSSDHRQNGHLAIACGFDGEETAAFMDMYTENTTQVRKIFGQLLAPI